MWQVGSNVWEEPAASIFGAENCNMNLPLKKPSRHRNATKILLNM
jgi:hypothetical protein